jgi:hypothetical protein
MGKPQQAEEAVSKALELHFLHYLHMENYFTLKDFMMKQLKIFDEHLSSKSKVKIQYPKDFEIQCTMIIIATILLVVTIKCLIDKVNRKGKFDSFYQ